jgi:hypothetical protein
MRVTPRLEAWATVVGSGRRGYLGVWGGGCEDVAVQGGSRTALRVTQRAMVFRA